MEEAMNVIVVLGILLFILMEEIGGKRGTRSFISLLLNMAVLYAAVILMAKDCNPFIVTLIATAVISCITLFFINKVNDKTVSAFISVLITLLLMVFFVYKLGTVSKIQGFGEEEYDEISSFSLYVNVDFSKLLVCTLLMGLIGAVIDVAVSVSSAMNELYRNNPSLTKGELFKSGMNVGRDILATMTNTIYFAFLGGYLALLIWFKDLSYSAGAIINSKVFCAEIIQILCSSLGAILVIPVTAVVTTYIMKGRQEKKR
jgi:uncharacterized membrane protein